AGGDLSEPVTQATLRFVKVFWGLSASLAYKRHFPAIDWIGSYSLYVDKIENWYSDNVSADWSKYRDKAMRILQEESSLDEIVRLVGIDALSPNDRLTMETAKSIREDYLHQDAYNEVDTYSSLFKQFSMLKTIVDCDTLSREALKKDVDLDEIMSIKARETIGRSKYIPEKDIAQFGEIQKNVREQLNALAAEE
ncbi:MAG: V-type ATP synthase subunit A, partial [Clostridia bacterium]